MKSLFTLIMLVLATGPSEAGDSLLVMFWNVENFFDWKDEGGGASDAEFSSGGVRRWTRKRFFIKCDAIAKTIFEVADRFGRLPDAIGFAEVENSFVLRCLLANTLLRKLDYRIAHFDSPDRRGIDCALLYRKSSFPAAKAAPAHLLTASGELIRTRDILVFEGEKAAILVNHHPSKVGGSSGERRSAAIARMNFLCDSLLASGSKRVLCIGDFNEDLWHSRSQTGTIKYNGAWEKIDGFFLRGEGKVEESVLDSPRLSEADKSFGGLKPKRTYIGPSYHGGVSDHYPVVFWLKF
ncbi:MAG: hypothetical protein J5764_00165 [Bacteroidales bacterium]|nr:hypothetical protein [Bacteroidales bacterium]MBO4446520.1 hypothetical protein [Bacteroidales bacterium]